MSQKHLLIFSLKLFQFLLLLPTLFLCCKLLQWNHGQLTSHISKSSNHLYILLKSTHLQVYKLLQCNHGQLTSHTFKSSNHLYILLKSTHLQVYNLYFSNYCNGVMAIVFNNFFFFLPTHLIYKVSLTSWTKINQWFLILEGDTN